MKREKLETANFCECGCGQITKSGSRFIRGHNSNRGFKGCTPWNKGITNKDDLRVGKKQGIRITVQCDACGKELKRYPYHTKRNKDRHNFCDRDCQTAFQKKPRKQRSYKKRLAFVLDPNVKCFWCGKPANFVFSTGNPCCERRPFRCSGFSTHSGPENGMFGKEHTKDTIKKMSVERRPGTGQKISEALMGKKKSPEHCKAISEGKKGLYTGPDNSIWGKTRSEKARKLTSEANKGNRNPSWRGGISFEPYSSDFNDSLKIAIKKRDNYKCQNPGCLNGSEVLTIHHINYDKGDTYFLNLITLCDSCNSKANFNRDFWQDFYQNLVETKQVVNL